MRVAIFAFLAASFGVAGAEDTHPAEMLVRETTEKVLAEVRNPDVRNDMARYQALVNDNILPHFDFERMARIVLGRNWRAFKAPERAAFITEFKQLLVRNYSAVLHKHAERDVDFRPIRVRKNGRVTVRTAVNNAGRGIPVDYSMYDADGTWKVYDVLYDGVSLIINFRRGFDTEFKASGAVGLIDKLKQTNARGANG